MTTMEDYLQNAYIDYVRKKGRLTSASDFAKYLGVSNTSLSQWMNGRRLPVGDNIHKLAAKLGPEIYDVLDTPRLMPDDPLFHKYADYYFKAKNKKEREALLDAVQQFIEKDLDDAELNTLPV